MWSAYTKYIRGQCAKDKICDSGCFGAYFRVPETSHICLTTKGAEDIIDFKCNENAQNYICIP